MIPFESHHQSFHVALDHLVLATDSLEAGCAYVSERFGADPEPGGQHLGWGTHNSLLQLGGGTYLEIIAPDPSQPGPERPRPFGLDLPAMRERIAIRPRLVHYLLRTDNIAGARAQLGLDAGQIVEMSRGSLHWKISSRQMTGHADDLLLPSFLDWGDQAPPAERLPARGVTMIALHLRGPAAYCDRLAPLRADRRIRISEHASAMLAAEFQTPRGWAILD